MTTITVAASKGAPGATTTALAVAAALVARDERATLVELDGSGGTLALAAQLGFDPGLLSLAAAGRRGVDPSLIEQHLQRLQNGIDVLLAPPSPTRTSALISALAPSLAESLNELESATVVDCGRWEFEEHLHPLIRRSTCVLLVLHPTVVGVEHARLRLDDLRDLNGDVDLVCVGERPYPATEVADALDFDADHVLTIADDPRTTDLLRTGTPLDRWMRRSSLLRSADRLLDSVLDSSKAEVDA